MGDLDNPKFAAFRMGAFRVDGALVRASIQAELPQEGVEWISSMRSVWVGRGVIALLLVASGGALANSGGYAPAWGGLAGLLAWVGWQWRSGKQQAAVTVAELDRSDPRSGIRLDARGLQLRDGTGKWTVAPRWSDIEGVAVKVFAIHKGYRAYFLVDARPYDRLIALDISELEEVGDERSYTAFSFGDKDDRRWGRLLGQVIYLREQADRERMIR